MLNVERGELEKKGFFRSARTEAAAVLKVWAISKKLAMAQDDGDADCLTWRLRPTRHVLGVDVLRGSIVQSFTVDMR